MAISAILFLLATTALAVSSVRVNYYITGASFRADQAFWAAWMLLIWSAEIVTSFPYFDYYYQYPIDRQTRMLTAIALMSAGMGYFCGSLLYKSYPGSYTVADKEERLISLCENSRAMISPAIFLIGLAEFLLNRSRFDNLLDLRLAAVDGSLETGVFYTQFFYFAQAFLLLMGFSDGSNGRPRRFTLLLAISGIVFHNLSVGGRIGLIVAPAVYFIPFVLRACERADWAEVGRPKVIGLLSICVSLFLISFPFLSLLRSGDFSVVEAKGVSRFLLDSLMAFPMYISDTFISISIHAFYASSSDMPPGYFTFDGLYRLVSMLVTLNIADPNTVFGHAFFRDTAAPWAWCQVNMIPRMISDFGFFFWVAIFLVTMLVQWLSLYRAGDRVISITVRSLMILSSAYTILATFWFSAANIYVCLYMALIYLLAGRDKSFSATLP